MDLEELESRIRELEVRVRELVPAPGRATRRTDGCTYGCTGDCPDPTGDCTYGCTFGCTLGCTDVCGAETARLGSRAEEALEALGKHAVEVG